MKRIKVIEKKTRRTFAETLEDRARSLIPAESADLWRAEPRTGIRSNIALTLYHLDSVRALHDDLSLRLLRFECDVRTDLLQLEPRGFAYTPDHHKGLKRDMLKARLIKIDEERRRLAAVRQEKLQGLHDRLLSLLNRHAQLRFD